MDDDSLADLTELLDEALDHLRTDPRPFGAEHVGAMLLAPPLHAGLPTADLADIVAFVEERPEPEAVRLLGALGRMFGPPVGPLAAAGAQRRGGDDGAVATEVVAAFVLEHDELELVTAIVKVSEEDVILCSVAAHRGEAPELGGGVNPPEPADQAAGHLDTLRQGTMGQHLAELDPADVRPRLDRVFAWAAEHDVPMSPELLLERPVLALAVTGGPDPWPALRVEDRPEEDDGPGGPAGPRRKQRPRRDKRRAAKAARRRNRRR